MQDGPMPGPEMMPPGPLPPGMPPPMPGGMPPPGMPGPKPKKPKLYTLDANDDYMAIVSVGPSQKTAKEANEAALTKLLDALGPELIPVVAPLFAKYALEGPVADEIEAKLRKMSPDAAQPDDDDADIPPEAQAQIFALQQQMAAADAMVKDLQTQIATKKYAVDANVAMANELNASRERIAQMQARVQMAVAEQRTLSAEETTAMKTEADMALQQLDHAHDRLMARNAAQADELSAAQEASLKLATTPATPRKD